MNDEQLAFHLNILNRIFELEKRLGDTTEKPAVARNFERLRRQFEEALPGDAGGLFLHDPYGEKYSDTRTDLYADTAGTGEGPLRIVETLKPIVYLRGNGENRIVQRGIVIIR